MRRLSLPAIGIFFLFFTPLPSIRAQINVATIDKYKDQALDDLQSRREQYKHIALQIWGFAELGYKETQSSALHKKTLTDNGFTIKAGVAAMPTLAAWPVTPVVIIYLVRHP